MLGLLFVNPDWKRKTELEIKIEQANRAEVNMTGIEHFCDLVRQNFRDFAFEDKRPTLES